MNEKSIMIRNFSPNDLKEVQELFRKGLESYKFIDEEISILTCNFAQEKLSAEIGDMYDISAREQKIWVSSG